MRRPVLPLDFETIRRYLWDYVKAHDAMFRNIPDILLYPDSAKGGKRLRSDLPHPFEVVLTKQDVAPSHPLYDLLGETYLNDVPVVGYLAGRRGHVPLYVALYVDNLRDVRAFIPKRGNAINPLTYTLYGLSPSDDDRVARFLTNAPYAALDLTDSKTLDAFYSKEMLRKSSIGQLKLSGTPDSLDT